LATRIRAERSGDENAIGAVVVAAFNSVEHGDLVAAIRASPHFVPELSLVAEMDDVIVGHVMISDVTLDSAGTQRRIASLSPLAVAPEHQRGGIGSALVRAVTARADELGEPLVVLEGDPGYYSRFGFEPSAPLGIHITLPSWAPPEAAQVLRLRGYDPSIRGDVVYPPAFDLVAE
jgi:putative acetyltransferase